MELNPLLRRAVQLGASDIDLKVGQPPILRRDGALSPMEGSKPLQDSDLEVVLAIVGKRSPERYEAFTQTGDLDTAYQDEDLPRFRVSAFRQRGSISFAFRVIPKNVPNFEQLALPQGIRRLAEEHRGLVLVTGATGSGKTTTLAAMIDFLNRSRQQHIVTIEDPIEIIHPDHSCIVNQREIGLDATDFMQALRRALRQDPDVILIGELRDAETAQTALQAAESGHLVLSTLHTVDAAETIGRMVEFFPETKQQMIRSIMAGVLRGVISQRLLPRIDGGRIAAVEVMVTNARIADLIRENKPESITEAIEEGSFWLKPGTDARLPCYGYRARAARRLSTGGRAAGAGFFRVLGRGKGGFRGASERLDAECARVDLRPGLVHDAARADTAAPGLDAPRPLAARGVRLRDSLAGARVHQQDRVELRPEHGPELCRRGRVDAVHALDVAALGPRRGRRRNRRSVEPGRRDLRGRAVSRCGWRADRYFTRDLCVQPRRLVRPRGARRRPCLRAGRHRGNCRSPAAPDCPRCGPRSGDQGQRGRVSRRGARRSPAHRLAATAAARRGDPAALRSPCSAEARGPLRRERLRGTRRNRGCARAASAGAGGPRERSTERPGTVVRAGSRDADGRAVVPEQLRLPGRGRPPGRLGRTHTSRLSRRGHRRPGRLTGLRDHEFCRGQRLALQRSPLRDRADDPRLRQSRLDLLSPRLSRSVRDRRCLPCGGRPDRPRGINRPRDRHASASSAVARNLVSPERGLVPELRGQGLPLAGRPDATGASRPPSRRAGRRARLLCRPSFEGCQAEDLVATGDGFHPGWGLSFPVTLPIRRTWLCG